MSMTGFGSGSAPFGGGRLTIEIRTVNHRFLEVRSRAPRELLAAEALIEKLLGEAIRRGYCTVHVSCEGAAGGGARIDERALGAHLDQLVRVAERHELCLADLIPVLSGAPDLFVAPFDTAAEGLEAALRSAFAGAAKGLLAMRRGEGAAMAAGIRKLLDEIRGIVGRVDGLAADQPRTLLERSRERIATLLSGTEFAVDPGRIEAEAALLADRADVGEEIARLRSHCRQAGEALDADGPVGRRLEFLVQEMGREANTLGAKAAVGDTTRLVVELKTALERLRELAQNVE